MFRKAALGAGFATGLADDIAAAGCWLVECDLDGAAVVLDAIRPGPSGPTALKRDGNVFAFDRVSAAVLGPSVIDLLVADRDSRVVLYAIDVPVLIAGLAGVASRLYGSCFTMRCNDMHALSILPTGIAIFDQNWVEAAKFELTIKDGEMFQNLHEPSGWGYDLDETVWRDLDEFAARTYVPSSEESRILGAGAGLTDND